MAASTRLFVIRPFLDLGAGFISAGFKPAIKALPLESLSIRSSGASILSTEPSGSGAATFASGAGASDDLLSAASFALATIC